MSIVIVENKNGTTKHFIDCRYEERGDKIVVVHDEQDLPFGGMQPIMQEVYDRSELESIKQED